MRQLSLFILLTFFFACDCGDGPGMMNPDAGVVVPSENCKEAGDPEFDDGDDDFDGIKNGEECELGLDPFSSDTDKDGISDRVEIEADGWCIADASDAQRFEPIPTCQEMTECEAGESCVKLDPLNPDIDGDGLSDGVEVGPDGIYSPESGELHPLLTDSNGDGVPDTEDPRIICTPEGLAELDQYVTPNGGYKIGVNTNWNAPRPAGNGLTIDQPTANVAAAVVEVPAGVSATATASGVESDIGSQINWESALVGQQFTTHEGHEAITSIYRATSGSNVGAVRDSIFGVIAGASATASPDTLRGPGPYTVNITTVWEDDTKPSAVLVSVSTELDYSDATSLAQIEAKDFTNTTGLAASNSTLGRGCDVGNGEAPKVVDFIWTVDTSGSMNSYQEDLGVAAGTFFDEMKNSGLDFRVGVFQAMSDSFSASGFQFIDGASSTGVRDLQFQVTDVQFQGMSADTRRPFPEMEFNNANEQPVAATIRAGEALSSAGLIRPDAVVVPFFVADEETSDNNGDVRYFGRDPSRWGSTPQARGQAILDYFQSPSNDYSQPLTAFGMIDISTSVSCPTSHNAAQCAIEGTGGAYVDIDNYTDASLRTAVDAMVTSIAGQSSRLILSATPISGALKVNVEGVDVPRSRFDGFDYNSASNSVFFRGETYRPKDGDTIVISYRVWVRRVGPG